MPPVGSVHYQSEQSNSKLKSECLACKINYCNKFLTDDKFTFYNVANKAIQQFRRFTYCIMHLEVVLAGLKMIFTDDY